MAIRSGDVGTQDVQAKPHRVQLDFSPEAYERLLEIRKRARLSTNADTIRSALRFYEWLVTDVNPNSIIKVCSPDGEVLEQFSARLLFEQSNAEQCILSDIV